MYQINICKPRIGNYSLTKRFYYLYQPLHFLFKKIMFVSWYMSDEVKEFRFENNKRQHKGHNLWTSLFLRLQLTCCLVRHKSLMIATKLSPCLFLPECPPGPVGWFLSVRSSFSRCGQSPVPHSPHSQTSPPGQLSAWPGAWESRNNSDHRSHPESTSESPEKWFVWFSWKIHRKNCKWMIMVKKCQV